MGMTGGAGQNRNKVEDMERVLGRLLTDHTHPRQAAKVTEALQTTMDEIVPRLPGSTERSIGLGRLVIEAERTRLGDARKPAAKLAECLQALYQLYKKEYSWRTWPGLVQRPQPHPRRRSRSPEAR